MREADDPSGAAPAPEQATDALVDGDVGFTPGTARAALAHRPFRIVWLGALLSSVGTWMQNVVLGAFAWELTGSTTFVGIVYFAQLGPSLVLPLVGGALADHVDRRRMLITTQAQQLAFSLVLAWVARGGDPSHAAIVVTVLLIGAGHALSGPAYSSLMPDLVGRRDLPGAVSLQGAQMNVSRVIGPAIGGALYPAVGPAWVFVLNAATYLFAIGSLLAVHPPRRTFQPAGSQGLRRLLSGFGVARRDALVRRVLVTMTVFSFFSLAFIGLMPVLAEDNLGLRTRSFAYGALYATFGVGAAAGAVSIGTLLAGRSKPRIVRLGLVAFAVLLATFALERAPALAYPTVLLLGFVYFATVTSLSTVLQEHLEDHVRGRVMALWIMSFGGTVPLGTLALSPVVDLTSVTAVALVGAAVALVLGRMSDLAAVGAPD